MGTYFAQSPSYSRDFKEVKPTAAQPSAFDRRVLDSLLKRANKNG